MVTCAAIGAPDSGFGQQPWRSDPVWLAQEVDLQDARTDTVWRLQGFLETAVRLDQTRGVRLGR